MPGIATHHVFGLEVHGALGELIGATDDEREAFLLGNLGPDPLFYLAVSPAWQRFRRLGSRMHAEDPTVLLDAIHTRLVRLVWATGSVRAYALGFLCHYLLDSAVHPLVYAQQHAICQAGVDDVGFDGSWLQRSVHATIETEIDEYVLASKLQTDAASYRPHIEMLKCSNEALASISTAMSGAIAQAYDLRVPTGLFASAVELNRVGQRLLDSKSGGLRGRIDFFPPIGYAVAYVRALSHEGAQLPATAFANADHIPWPHPYRVGETFDASFDKLYEQTYCKALDVLPAYCAEDFDEAACRRLTQGVNFLGRG